MFDRRLTVKRFLRATGLALALLLPLVGSGLARSDPPAPSGRDGIDDLIRTAGGQKADVPKRGADDKEDPADLLKGLDSPKPVPSKTDPDRSGADAPGPPGPKPSPRPAGLPKHYDQLDLTRDQIDKVHKVSEKYDGRIAELKQKLERLRGAKLPGSTGATLVLITTIKKLTPQRHQALIDILTEEQQSKLKTLYAAEKK
jgi:hypothetical protein